MRKIDNTKKKRFRITSILPKRESQAFGSIEVYPKKVTFRTQNPGERVYILVRAHVLTNLGWLIQLCLSSIVPILFFLFLDYFNIDLNFIGESLVFLLVLTYYISTVCRALMSFLRWYYNIYLVTSERIIHYQFDPLTIYKVSEAEIENIQDISQASLGFLPNMFGYGDIMVQTASVRNKFYFKAVPRPVWFRDVLADLAALVRTNEP